MTTEEVKREFGDVSDPTNKLIYRPGFQPGIKPGFSWEVGGTVIREITKAEYWKRHYPLGYPDSRLPNRGGLGELLFELDAYGFYEIDLDLKPEEFKGTLWDMIKERFTWSKEPNEKGLARVCQSWRGFNLKRNGEIIIRLRGLGDRYSPISFYWCGLEGVNTLTHKLTFSTVDLAKSHALTHAKLFYEIKKTQTNEGTEREKG